MHSKKKTTRFWKVFWRPKVLRRSVIDCAWAFILSFWGGAWSSTGNDKYWKWIHGNRKWHWRKPVVKPDAELRLPEFARLLVQATELQRSRSEKAAKFRDELSQCCPRHDNALRLFVWWKSIAEMRVTWWRASSLRRVGHLSWKASDTKKQQLMRGRNSRIA